MTELSEIFDRLGLLQYLESFINEGFETWEVVLYVTESDLYALSSLYSRGLANDVLVKL